MRIINIGLLGLGTVGSGVVQLLEKQAAKIELTTNVHFNLKSVAVAHLNKKRDVTLPSDTKLTNQINDVVNDPEIQIVIETMGTIHLAKKAIIRAIRNRKSVITANKDLLAIEGPTLAKLASESNVDFFYEASVAGGIPILRVLSNSLITDDIQQVTGIINGTSNYILSSMADNHVSYYDALQVAQAKGYAELNPTNDIKGIDSTNKLSILSQFAFGQGISPNDLKNNGIDNITTDQLRSASFFGYTIKLLAVALRKNDRLYSFVGPTLVSNANILSQIKGVQNAVLIESSALGTSLYTGPGAGGHPTANSILSDLTTIAKNIINSNCGMAFNRYTRKLKVLKLNNEKRSYMLTKVPLNFDICKSILQSKRKIDDSLSVITKPIGQKELNTLINEAGTKIRYLPVY